MLVRWAMARAAMRSRPWAVRATAAAGACMYAISGQQRAFSALRTAHCSSQASAQGETVEFSVGVQSRFMFAHTLAFPPAVPPFLTGGTYVVQAVVSGNRLVEHDILINIILLDQLLADVCSKYHHRNLDELAEFAGRNSTVEVMAAQIWTALASALEQRAASGEEELSQLTCLQVKVAETDVAWASYKRALPPMRRHS
eukprot:g37532.t1